MTGIFSLGQVTILRVPARHGDHLHAFTVAGARYSAPFFGLEETADEEAVRLRDAFPVGARKPVRYEYDFGAGWVHEIGHPRRLIPPRPRGDCSPPRVLQRR